MTESKTETVQRITELVEDGRLFDSDGFSRVKVTKGGQAQVLELPIKSTGVAEYQEQLRAKAPRPPVTWKSHKKGSQVAQDLGVNGPVRVPEFNTLDDTYLDALEAHEQAFTWKVAVFALGLNWTRKDGKPAETYAEKVTILKRNGITGHQIGQIFQDVQDLTRLNEERQDFLSGD